MTIIETYSDEFVKVCLLDVKPYFLVTFSRAEWDYVKFNTCLCLEQAINLYSHCIKQSEARKEMS